MSDFMYLLADAFHGLLRRAEREILHVRIEQDVDDAVMRDVVVLEDLRDFRRLDVLVKSSLR